MSDNYKLTTEFDADVSKLQSGIKDAQSAVDGMENTLNNAFGDMDKGLSGLGSSAKIAGNDLSGAFSESVSSISEAGDGVSELHSEIGNIEGLSLDFSDLDNLGTTALEVGEDVDGLSINLDNLEVKDIDSSGIEGLGDSIEGAGEQISLTETMLEEFGDSAGDLDKAVLRMQASSEDLDTSFIGLGSSTDGLGDSFNEIGGSSEGLGKALGGVGDTAKDTGGEFEELGNSSKTLSESLTESMDKLEKVSKKIEKTGTSLTKKVTLPIVGAATASIKFAMDYETAMTGVAKTTDLTDRELQDMKESITEMTRVMPVSAKELAGIAESGGQLGIAKENLLGFTEVIANIGVATNLTSEEAANGFARIASVTGLSQTEFSNMGSTLVALGNNFATNEKAILDMTTRLMGTGTMAGLTESQILALATAMGSVDISAEAGGSAMSSVMQKINTAVMSGSDELYGFAEVAGKSGSEFAKIWESDPQEAIYGFVKGLGDMNNEGKDTATTLAELGISGLREVDTLNRLGLSHETLAEAFAMSDEAWKSNTALTEEANVAYDTTASRMTIAMNAIREAGTAIGDILLPVVAKVADFVADLAISFAGLHPSIQTVVIIIGGLLAVIGPMLVVIGKIGTGVSTIIGIFGKMGSVMSGLSTVIGFIFSPAGLIIVGIIAVVAVIIWMIKNWDKVKEWFSAFVGFMSNIWSVIVDVFKAIWSALVSWFMLIWDGIKAYFTAYIEFYSMVWTVIVDFFMAIWTTLVEWFMAIWEGIKVFFTAYIEFYNTLWTIIIDFFMEIWTTLIEWFMAIWEGVKIFFTAYIEFYNTLWTVIIDFFMAIWATLIEWFMAIWEGVKIFFTAYIEFYSTLWTVIIDFFMAIWSAVIEWFKGKWEGVKETFNNLKVFIMEIWETIKNTVVDKVTNLVNRAVELFTSLYDSVKEKVDGVKDAVGDAIQGAYDTVTGWFANFKEAGSNIIGNIAEGILGGWGPLTGAISNVLGKVRDFLPFSPPKDKTSPMADIHKNGIGEQIAKGIYGGQGEVDTAMDSLLSGYGGLGVGIGLDSESLDMDLGSHRRELGAMVNGTVRATVDTRSGDNMVDGKQPAYITVRLGRRDIEMFSEDIFDAQNKKERRRNR